jgi:hypothetical protein
VIPLRCFWSGKPSRRRLEASSTIALRARAVSREVSQSAAALMRGYARAGEVHGLRGAEFTMRLGANWPASLNVVAPVAPHSPRSCNGQRPPSESSVAPPISAACAPGSKSLKCLGHRSRPQGINVTSASTGAG